MSALYTAHHNRARFAVLGHTLANLSLAHLSPLVVAVSGLWEPLVGSVLGYLVGVQGVPGIVTLAAGPLLMVGCVLTTVGARDSGLSLHDVLKCLKGRDSSGAIRLEETT